MIALLSDKVEFGRVEQPTRLAAMKVVQATRKVLMKRDYSEFPNSLVPARNAVPKYQNDTEKQSMRCAPSKETKPSRGAKGLLPKG
jgi:hypothetical protein